MYDFLKVLDINQTFALETGKLMYKQENSLMHHKLVVILKLTPMLTNIAMGYAVDPEIFHPALLVAPNLVKILCSLEAKNFLIHFQLD